MMTPERWREVTGVFHAALARDGSARASYLDEACGGDRTLRAEVDAMLAAHAAGAQFGDTPVSVSTVNMPRLTSGARLGPYRIDGLIGTGGMGEVYRGRDMKLGRDVAIKVLPGAFTSDPDQRARFEREARLLAALNHPRIAAIHSFEESPATGSGEAAVHALVLELVEGPTLADRLRRGPLPMKEALDVARQIAEALEAAHEHGIVHRDLKPANIKITADGTVKVLDFGLAKAFAAEGVDLSQVPTISVDGTQTGVIAGTPGYMSPEQARGQAVDKRTDIWAFGCLLYEMLTGKPAFPGETISDTIAAILDRELNWDALPEKTPATLRRLLQRCLEKDGRRRLRDIAAVRFALEDSTGDIERAATPRTAANHSWRTGLAVSTTVVLGAAVGVGWWAGRQSVVPADNPLANPQFTRFTDFPGDERDAAISRDGRFVAFVSDREGPFDVWVSQVGTGRFRNLTQGTEVADDNPSNRELGFSPDGSEIWLAGRALDRRLRLMPLLGGAPRVFLQGNAINASWSPDGALVVYNTAAEPGDPMFVADRTGANAKRIYVNPLPAGHNHFPVWSPDGRWIYFVSGLASTREMDLWRIAPSGGAPERLTHHNNDVTYPTPIDSTTVLYLSPAEDNSGPWLWVLDTERQITRRAGYGLEKYISLAASSDGRRLVATVSNPAVRLWSAPILDRAAVEADVTPFPVPTVRALAPRFGARALFYLSSLGSGDGLWRYQDNEVLEIWKGTDGILLEPAGVSADGKRVAISLRREGKVRLNIVGDDGTGLTPVADSIDVRGSPSWSPDGNWIVTGGIDAKGPGLFKIPVDGGAPIRLTAEAALDPVWSPDGGLIVYVGPYVSGYQTLRAIRSDGTPVELPAIRLRFATGGERHRFLPDGKGLVYMQDEGTLPSRDFWLFDLATRKSRRLTDLADSGRIRTFDITPDGKQIIFDRLRENADIVLIDLPR